MRVYKIGKHRFKSYNEYSSALVLAEQHGCNTLEDIIEYLDSILA